MRFMEDDRQMDEQTDDGRVRVLDATNRQAGRARGRGGGPAQPRGYRPRLDICSGVKWRLARAANLSCQSSWWLQNAHLSRSSKSGGWAANTTGQRSRFILHWGWTPGRPLGQASICRSFPPPLRCTCLPPVVLCVVVKPTFLPASVSRWGSSIVWERNWRAFTCRFRWPQRSSTEFTFCYRVVATHPSMWSVLIGDICPSPPPKKTQTNNMEKFDQQCRKVEHRREAEWEKKTMWPRSFIFLTKKGKSWGYDVCTW